jgi:hypothetical protein
MKEPQTKNEATKNGNNPQGEKHVHITITHEVHSELKIKAIQSGMNLGEYLVFILTNHVAA